MEKSPELLAIHEAGRAITACVLQRRFEQVSISPNSSSVDLDTPLAELDDQQLLARWLEEKVLVGLGGAASEAFHTSHSDRVIQTLVQDYGVVGQDVSRLLPLVGGSDDPGARDILVLSLWERVLKLLNTHWGAVTVLSDLLRDLETVGWVEVCEIFEHTTRWRTH